VKKEIIGKYVAILGLLLFWAPLWGIADSYFTMASSFQEITLFGTNDPKIAPEEMTSAAMFTAIGALLSMVGLILLAIAVVGLNYRKSWFFWALIIYSILLLIIIPIGTFFGLMVLTVLVLNRKKFGAVNHLA
tara:strand:- start:111 stop:509 length:399 start_codon:yes stop_codon:yes gene_type:complete